MRVLSRLFLVDISFEHDEFIDKVFAILRLHQHRGWVTRQPWIHHLYSLGFYYWLSRALLNQKTFNLKSNLNYYKQKLSSNDVTAVAAVIAPCSSSLPPTAPLSSALDGSEPAVVVDLWLPSDKSTP